MSSSTNETIFSYSIEETPGKLPVSPTFKSVEPNDVSSYGATISSVPRNPISESRGNKKGSTTDLDSAAEFPADLTIESFLDFSQGVMYAEWYKQPHFVPTAVTATGYTVASGGNLTAGALIFARGFQNSENNGLKIVGAGSTATEVKTTGLVLEAAPPPAAEVDVSGVQGATGDLEINATGDLISTSLDFTTLGLTPGQSIWIGGTDEVTDDVTFAEEDNQGLARVRVVEAHKVYLDNRKQTYTTDDGAGKTIQIFIGSFIRDVPTTSPKFKKETYTFEATYNGLGVAENETWYEYSIGNYANNFTFSWPGQALATLTSGFIGLDTLNSTQTQTSATRKKPSKTAGFNTTSDFTRLRMTDIDENGLTTYFDSLDITINNNVSARKVIGTLGAAFINIGTLDITGSTSVIFTDTNVINAVRNNCTVSLDFALANSDGALHFNIPSMTVGGADKNFPRNESITLNISTNAFEDTFFGFSLGVTHYPYIPTAGTIAC